MYVPANAVTPRRAFIPNQFPYDIPTGCRHYVLWYAGVGTKFPTDDQVCICVCLYSCFPSDE